MLAAAAAIYSASADDIATGVGMDDPVATTPP